MTFDGPAAWRMLQASRPSCSDLILSESKQLEKVKDLLQLTYKGVE